MIIDDIRRHYHLSRYKLVKGMLDGHGNLLDIGCGRPCECMEDGSFIKFLGYGTGMDVKDCTGDFDFRLGNINEMPFDDSSFDVVVAMEVLEHIDDPLPAIKEVHRVLRDGGMFIMSTPNNNTLWKIIWFFWQRSFGDMWKGEHKVQYTKSQWLDLVRNYFEIDDVRGYAGINLIIKSIKR